jgi:hypothetical protein
VLVTLTIAFLVSLLTAFAVVSLTGGGVLAALATAGVTGYLVAGWPGAVVGTGGVVAVSVLVVALGGEVGPEEHLFVLPIALVVDLYFVGGIWGVLAGIALLGLLGRVSFLRAARRHHKWLEPRIAVVLRAYNEGPLDDMTAALDQLPYGKFDQGCKTCLPLLHSVERVRRDLGSARGLVHEYGYPLDEAWVIVRAFGSDRARYEETRQRASITADPPPSAPLDTMARFAAARAAIERAKRPTESDTR